MTNRRGMRSIFTEADIELMLAIRREAEAREARAATKSSQAKRSVKSQLAKATPDRKIAPKKKVRGGDGMDRSPKD
jgi:hypothetical protein